MAWVAVGTAVVGAAASAYGARQQKKAAEKAAKAASGPSSYDRTTERTPWGPSVGHRENIMGAAWDLFANRGQSGGRGGRGGGGGDAAMAAGGAKRPGGGGGGGGRTAQGHINAILGGKYLDGNPHLDSAIEASQRGLEDRFNQQFAQGDLAAEASGRLGGGSHQLMQARAFNDFNTAAGDIDAEMRYKDYNDRMEDVMDALGLATQLDITRMNNAVTRRGQDLSHKVGMANVGVARGQLSLERQMLPFRQLGAVSDIVQTMSGPYGTTHETGTEQGPQRTAAPTQDPLLAAFQGGVAGWQLGTDLQRTWNPNGGLSQQPVQPMQTTPRRNPNPYARL